MGEALLLGADLGYIPHTVLAGYLVLLLVLGWVGYLYSNTGEEDYYLAGRQQGWVVSSLSIMATFFSSFALLGAPGLVYREGVVFALFSLNVPLAGVCVYLLGARIWQLGRTRGYVTPADMVGDYYGSRIVLPLLVALAGVLYAIPYVMMQIKAGGEICAVLFSRIDMAFEYGAILLATITTAYIMIGGMRSVAWTDVLQGVLLMCGMLLGGAAMVAALGGITGFGEQVAKLPARVLTLPGTTGEWPWLKLFTVCLLAPLGAMVQPAQWMRFYSAKGRNTLRRGALIFALLLPPCFLLGIMLVGLGGQVLYPVQMTAEGFVAPHPDVGSWDQILIVFLRDHLPEMLGAAGLWLAALVIVGVMAASMSTADSSLHALSAVFVRDLYDRYIRPRAPEKERVWIGRGVIVAATALSLVLVIVGERQAGGSSKPGPAPKPDSAASVPSTDQAEEAAQAAPGSGDPGSGDGAPGVGDTVTGDIVVQSSAADGTASADTPMAAVSPLEGAAPNNPQTAVAKTPPTRGGKVYDFMMMIAKLGLLAIAFSAQLLPLTFDILFLRKGTAAGASIGLAAGLAVAVFMGPLWPLLVEAVHASVPQIAVSAETPLSAWREARQMDAGWMIQSLYFAKGLQAWAPMDTSAWGLAVNIPLFVLVSCFSRRVPEARRREFAQILRDGT
jgi:SSS family solute:Na+ symporter